MNTNSEIFIKGKAQLQIFKKNKLIEERQINNVVLNQGKLTLITSIAAGRKCKISKIAVGDGALGSSDYSNKLPTKDMKAMYHEVFRKEIESFEVTNNSEVVFTVNVNSLEISRSLFSNMHDPFLNEIGLVISANELTEESLFSLLTFSSIPFKSTDGISITIRYTISMG